VFDQSCLIQPSINCGASLNHLVEDVLLEDDGDSLIPTSLLSPPLIVTAVKQRARKFLQLRANIHVFAATSIPFSRRDRRFHNSRREIIR